MRYWWVNQNQTYRAETRGCFMWSPKQNANGARNRFYENMREVSPGDVVFSFCDTRIKAIGVVTGRGQTGPKPDFGAAGSNWSQEGWYVPVEYWTLDNQLRPKDHIAILRPFLPSKYSPLQDNGDGLQSVYLDHLFDEGYITFSTSQELVIVPEVRDKLLEAWGIDAGVRVGEFSREQSAYLDYHRVNVFKHQLLARQIPEDVSH
jgi:hypothetical protein